jgi:alkanesulfonate monooxygenase SsuD/methylene tetrahydromethanopterin reductase-like flavin-dependent oxidoreductase (luciferase family)
MAAILPAAERTGGSGQADQLGTIVTSVAYRHPGVLVKSVTSLDVLSGGRVFFGVGAGAPWNVAPAGPGTAFEAEGLGIPFPSLAERFERLEELLQIAHQMWRGDERPYQGRHYQLVRPLNSPNSVQRPHPEHLPVRGLRLGVAHRSPPEAIS